MANTTITNDELLAVIKDGLDKSEASIRREKAAKGAKFAIVYDGELETIAEARIAIAKLLKA